MSADIESSTILFPSHFQGNTTFHETVSMSLRDADRDDLAKVFSLAEAVGLSVFLGVLSVFGITANVVTFLVIIRTPKLHSSVFNIFLMSLCVSDFLSAITSPFILYRATWGFYEWSIPAVFCKLAMATDFWTSCVTIQHILVFAILRLFSIKFPHKYSAMKPLHAKITVFVLWVEGFAVSFIVYFLWPGVFPPGERTPTGDISKACTAQREWIKMLMGYVQFGFPIVLYAPMVVVIIVTAALTVLILKRKKSKNKVANQSTQAKKAARKENFALIQLSLILASFMLGYLPDIAYRMTAVILRNANSGLSARSEWQFSMTGHCMLRVSECLNPIFYNLGSSNMRKGTREFLHPILCCGSNFVANKQRKTGTGSTGAS